MKSTEAFKKVIKNYLEDRGSRDPLFSRIITKPGKNIDDCITYILNTVKESGANGFTDDEVYSMAIHYFNEDKIDVGRSITGLDVRVNHHVDLTDEDKVEAKKTAMDQLVIKEKETILKNQKKEEEKKKKHLEKKAEKADVANKTLF